MDKEFCFKDLFAYYLKRWLIVAVSIIVSVFLFLTAFVLRDKHKAITIKATASFYGITQFVADAAEMGISQDNAALVSVYQKAASGVHNAMNSDYVKASFVATKEFKSEFSGFLSQLGQSADKLTSAKLSDSFVRLATFEANDNSFSISIEGRLDSSKKVEGAKKILSLYLNYAADYAYESQGIKRGSIVLLDPIEVIEFDLKDSASTYYSDYLKSLGYGFFVGLLVGAMIIFVMFSLDSRLKSFQMQMSDFGGGLIKVSTDFFADEDTVLSIINKLNSNKVLLCAAAKKEELCTRLSSEICKSYAIMGLKALHIDLFSKGNTPLLDALKSKEFERTDNYSVLKVSHKKDVTTFISHKKELEDLKLRFDKIIISYCEEGLKGAAAIKDYVDKVLYVVNQKDTKFSLIKELGDELSKDGIALGTYVFNSV